MKNRTPYHTYCGSFKRVDTAIGHKENTKLIAMYIVIDTEKLGIEMGHMMKRTTYHIYCHIAVVTEKVATEIGQSKDMESFNVCIVVETKKVTRGKVHMKKRTTYHKF